MLVFLKHPTPGLVKTRLASTVGAERAAELYRSWITQVLTKLQPLRPALSVIGAIDGADPKAFADWDSLVDGWWTQPAGNLGNRLDAGFRTFQQTNNAVFAIGTDCLEIDPELIRQALVVLRKADVVFGPTGDGGYYLVGLSRFLPGFFDSIRWSSPDTLSDHLSRCREHHWQVELLPQRDDIDTWDDWVAYCERGGIAPTERSQLQ